jgi:hypothetical protein
MNNPESIEYTFNDLKPEIDGYKKRIMVLDDFVVIEYSKRQLFFRHVHPDAYDSELIDENLLFDVVARNEEEAVIKMKKKIEEYESSKSQ